MRAFYFVVTYYMIFRNVVWIKIGLVDNGYKVIWDCVKVMESDFQPKVVSVTIVAGCGDAQQVK